MTWISVKERLPEVGEPVIVFCAKPSALGFSEEIFVAMLTELRSLIPGYENTHFWEAASLERGTNVTHWMPLPEPPKEGE